VIGAIAWGVIALSVASIETLARKGRKVSHCAGLVSRARRSLAGRLGLLVIWALMGWHLFARYTLHGF
jgi:hypothetical protein